MDYIKAASIALVGNNACTQNMCNRYSVSLGFGGFRWVSVGFVEKGYRKGGVSPLFRRSAIWNYVRDKVRDVIRVKCRDRVRFRVRFSVPYCTIVVSLWNSGHESIYLLQIN